MTLNGPTVTSAASCARGETRARGSITSPVSGATIISAFATSTSPTSAAVGEAPDSLERALELAVRISWSPGSTGLRKRALSMPTK